MGAVAGEDEDQSDFGVIEDLVVVGSAVFKAELIGHVAGAEAGSSGYAAEVQALEALHSRQQRTSSMLPLGHISWGTTKLCFPAVRNYTTRLSTAKVF